MKIGDRVQIKEGIDFTKYNRHEVGFNDAMPFSQGIKGIMTEIHEHSDETWTIVVHDDLGYEFNWFSEDLISLSDRTPLRVKTVTTERGFQVVFDITSKEEAIAFHDRIAIKICGGQDNFIGHIFNRIETYYETSEDTEFVI